jgi:hypothetical protein
MLGLMLQAGEASSLFTLAQPRCRCRLACSGVLRGRRPHGRSSRKKVARYKSGIVGELSGPWDTQLLMVAEDLAAETRLMVEARNRARAAAKELERLVDHAVMSGESCPLSTSAIMDISQRAEGAQTDLAPSSDAETVTDLTLANLDELAAEALETRDVVAFLLDRYFPREPEET